MKTAEFANSVDLDEVAHYEPTLRDLHCFPSRSRGIMRDIFSIFYNMKVYCVCSLESPDRGGSNEYTQHTIFNMNKKNTLNYRKSAAMGFF